MGRRRVEQRLDPATGKQLPQGVRFRGPSQYSARKLVNGGRVARTFATAREAARWLTEAEADKRRGTFIDLTEAEKQTLGALIERYVREVLGEFSEKRGADKEAGHLKVVQDDPVCAIRMSRLTSADLASFRDRMREVGYAPATIVRRLNLIQTIIEHARREWRVQLPLNPAQIVKRPAGADRKRDRIFVPPPIDDPNNGEEARLLAACDADSPLLGEIVRFALLTAMRQGEIVGLDWVDPDLDRSTIWVRGAQRDVTKNGEVRQAPLLPAAVQLLRNRPGIHKGQIFPMDQNVLKMRFRRAATRAGVVDLTFHDLRHIATTRLAKIYKNPLDLRLVTGHKDLKSLARYYHTSAEELAEAARLAAA